MSGQTQANLALQEREEVLQLFFKYVPSGIAMFDRQMHYLMTSQRWVEDYHLGSVEAVIGRSHYEIFPEISEQWRQIHQRCLAGATERCEADCFERKDGTRQWIRWEVRPWYQSNQDIGGIIIFSEDITERQQAEVALQESQCLLQRQLAEIEAIYQSAPVGLNIMDTDLRFVRINQHLAEMNGLSVEAHLGRTVREVLPELADAAEHLLRPILTTGEPLLNVEISGETPARPGIQRTWVESFLPLKEGDRVIGISTVCEEITDRKQAEEALRRAKAELEVRVAERTEDLQQANERLQTELLQRARIERELQESAASLRSLYQVIAARHQSFEQRIQDLLAIGCQLFGMEFGILARVQAEHYQVMVARSPDHDLQAGATFNVKQTLCCGTLDIDEPLTVEHTAASQWRNHSASTAFHMERYIGMRILVDDKVHSTLSFSSKTPALEQFKSSHKELLKLMAQWIGTEIERQQAETELRHMSAALENAVSGISRLDTEGRYIAVNQAYASLAGYEPEEMLSMNWERTVHPDDLERVGQAYQQMLRDGKVEVEAKGVRKDGSTFYKQLVMISAYNDQHQFVGHHCFMKDITDRKHAEAALQESNSRWRTVLDNVQLAVIERDVNGVIEYANPFFLQLTEYRAEEVLSRNWFDTFLVPAQRQAAEAHFQQALAQNSHTHYQNSILTKSGKECIFAWNNTILRDPNGQPVGKVSIGEDITERYKVERMKAEFISVVSHELRTPLTSMQAGLSLLSGKIIDPASEEGEATIQIAVEGTDRLVRLVNDILDLERLESGKIRLDKHPCYVGQLVEAAVAQMQELAKQVDITLETSPCKFQLEADSDRLLQVLTNLLSNAIKFSPNHAVVRLAVTQQRGEGDQPLASPTCSLPSLLFTVQDEGRGIPGDNLESIFDRFHQVDASDSREKGGTGLGLAICRSIVQQHGGAIWVESRLGKGSTFYFTIPLVTGEKRAH